MLEIKNISNKELLNNNKINSQKTNDVNNLFSSYLGETKKLDDIFQSASQKYGVSVDLLKAIGKAESNFDTKAVSRSGAQGVMQLMPKTAAYLGVKDSFDAEQNIMGGAKYISELLQKYDGNTSFALAAYNAGSNNVAKYGGIPPFKETQNYVKKVVQYMKDGVDTNNVYVVRSTPSYQRVNTLGSVDHVHRRQSLVDNVYDKQSLLEEVFSYEDYLKFLSLFINETDDKESEEKENYSTAFGANVNISSLLKFRNM